MRCSQASGSSSRTWKRERAGPPSLPILAQILTEGNLRSTGRHSPASRFCAQFLHKKHPVGPRVSASMLQLTLRRSDPGKNKPLQVLKVDSRPLGWTMLSPSAPGTWSRGRSMVSGWPPRLLPNAGLWPGAFNLNSRVVALLICAQCNSNSTQRLMGCNKNKTQSDCFNLAKWF